MSELPQEKERKKPPISPTCEKRRKEVHELRTPMNGVGRKEDSSSPKKEKKGVKTTPSFLPPGGEQKREWKKGETKK